MTTKQASSAEVDLTLLKALVKELEDNIEKTKLLKTDVTNPTPYLLEISKCTGLAMGISSEAQALIGDLLKIASVPVKEDPYSKILQSLTGTSKN